MSYIIYWNAFALYAAMEYHGWEVPPDCVIDAIVDSPNYPGVYMI